MVSQINSGTQQQCTLGNYFSNLLRFAITAGSRKPEANLLYHSKLRKFQKQLLLSLTIKKDSSFMVG
jgi:hypothetical protein